ncbi:MAG: TetR/AcrR family transcriptional regulator [Kutzneria sp.]|nr:TetR/AcrR family transcriptional regulator [Kutzneria sp.]MBV9846194.1 TetR/AcrR family transcriptional regulator [Kutzneria sp.]
MGTYRWYVGRIVIVVTTRPRRLEYSESTRDALVSSAVELFTLRGYSATSLDEVAKRARVTKGALYHHFTGKQALFEAAFAAVECKAMRRLGEIVSGAGRVWDAAMAGLRGYLGVCLDPAFQRIVVHEGPAVMGVQRWREAEERCSIGVIRAQLEKLHVAGQLVDLPLEVATRLLHGALSAGATMIANSPDSRRTGEEVVRSITRILEGLRPPAARAELDTPPVQLA